MKRLFGFLLIISFFVVLSPRNWWHTHHSEHNSTEKLAKSEANFSQDHCFACDFDLSTAHVSEPVFFKNYQDQFDNTPTALPFNVAIASKSNHVNKGPPQMI
jgi:hypothetical protein